MVSTEAAAQTTALLFAKRIDEAPRSIVEFALRVSTPAVSATAVCPVAPRKVPPARSRAVDAPSCSARTSFNVAPFSTRTVEAKPRDAPVWPASSSTPPLTTTGPPRTFDPSSRSRPAPVLPNPDDPEIPLPMMIDALAGPTSMSPAAAKCTPMARPGSSSSESEVPGAELASKRPPEPSRRSVPTELAELL